MIKNRAQLIALLVLVACTQLGAMSSEQIVVARLKLEAAVIGAAKTAQEAREFLRKHKQCSFNRRLQQEVALSAAKEGRSDFLSAIAPHLDAQIKGITQESLLPLVYEENNAHAAYYLIKSNLCSFVQRKNCLHKNGEPERYPCIAMGSDQLHMILRIAIKEENNKYVFDHQIGVIPFREMAEWEIVPGSSD